MASFVIKGKVAPRRTEGTTIGYAVTARMLRRVSIDAGNPADVIDAPASGSTRVVTGGAFRLEIGGDGQPVGPVTLTVSAPDGTQVFTRQLTLDEAGKNLNFEVETVERRVVAPLDDPSLGQRTVLTGRVVDARGGTVAPRLPVVIWGTLDNDDKTPAAPIVVTETQTGGYFSAAWPAMKLRFAEGRVAGKGSVPIPLDSASRLPLTVLLVLDLEIQTSESPCDCDKTPPRAPEPADLVNNPSAFSQDLGGSCVDLTTPNRTIEEFAYRFVVRTSEPKVKGLTLGVSRTVPAKLLGDLLGASIVADFLSARPVDAMTSSSIGNLKLDVSTARHLVRADRPPSLAAVTRAAWLSEVSRTKNLIDVSLQETTGRALLNGSNPIDWDETPTVHQAIELAHGHVLQIREVWRADGFSLGDLLYSLPLAPGQRRRVAIVDWERRSRSEQTEALEFEEELNAFLGRDRDVTEIVRGSLQEETAGGSGNTTWGVAGGMGAGVIGEGFGVFGGVAGGAGGSSSSAWQQSSRTFATDSLQRLRDRVTQRASSLRDLRSTVVQSVAQSEAQRVETEVVANYNRCHAFTVEYFEVLRHFLVSHELADVTECLFVPFQIAQFDRSKALRWRDPLRRFLRDQRLADGFVALRRIEDGWRGWEYPESRYSEEAPETLEGELRISFILPRPRDDKDGQFQVDFWRPWRSLLPVDAFELWTAKMNERAARDRDNYFRTEVAPQIAERLVQRLRFAYVTNGGNEVEVSLDPTLVSRYVEGVPLYITLNPRGPLPPVPREEIAYFKIWYDGDELPPDARVIAHSGKVRYRSPHSTGVLFSEGRILDDIGTSDPAVVPTPLARWELRNPRWEDLDLADRLVGHLNEHLEYYHQAIWGSLDPERRYMLLDSILVEGQEGRSVASICSNELIGIVGNSLVLPLAPGKRLDPTIDTGDQDTPPTPLIDAYNTNPLPPTRISVPTRGVYAEAIAGKCNGCEPIDDTRYWRWSTEGLLAPPEIAPAPSDSRADDEPDLKPTPLPSPLVSIQNAPTLPAPASLTDAFGLIATKDLFRDITGLEATQKNAMAAFEASMSAASALGTEAAKLASQNELGRNASRMLDRIDKARASNLLSPTAAQDLAKSLLQGLIGEARPTDLPPMKDGAVKKVVDEAAQGAKANIKVSTPTETVEVSFDDDVPAVGAASAIGQFDVNEFVAQDAVLETFDFRPGTPRITETLRKRTFAGLRGALGPDLVSEWTANGIIRPDPADAMSFQVSRMMRIVYPANPKNTAKLQSGSHRFPVALLLHGNHQYWDGTKQVPNHEGYTYLQQDLAWNGIVSVSVDTNFANALGGSSLIEMRAEIALAALDALRALDRDASSRFHKRLDFSKVGLMGHSRGGDAVVRAAIRNAARPTAERFGIKAVCSLAPTDFTGTTSPTSVLRLTPNHTPFYLVVYGGLDGDVAGWDGATGLAGTGYRHYDRATTQKAMVFLDHCNHNRFNDVWGFDEVPADAPRLISRPGHRTLAIEYIGGLFRMQLLGASAPAKLLRGTTGNSVAAGASIQWSFGKAILTLDQFESAAAPDLGARTIHAATVEDMAGITVKRKKIGERTNHQTRVLAIKPNMPGPPAEVWRLKLPAGNRNWSGYDALIFRVCADADLSSEAKILASPLPDFTLVLKDTAGGSAVITADSLRVPNMRPRLPVFHELLNSETATVENLSAIHLETFVVELDGMSGIDITKIDEIALTPPIGFKDFQFFDSFQLIKREIDDALAVPVVT